MKKNLLCFLLIVLGLSDLTAQHVDTLKIQIFDDQGKYDSKLLPDVYKYNAQVVPNGLKMELSRGILQDDIYLKIHIDTVFSQQYDSVVLMVPFSLAAQPQYYFKSKPYIVSKSLLDSVYSAEFKINDSFSSLYSGRTPYVKLCQNCSSIKIDTTFTVKLDMGRFDFKASLEGRNCLLNNCNIPYDFFSDVTDLNNYYFSPDTNQTQLKIRQDFCTYASNAIKASPFMRPLIYQECMDLAHTPRAWDMQIFWAFSKELLLWQYKKCSSLNPTISQNGNTLTTNITGATYQWLDCSDNFKYTGASAQSFIPSKNGLYAVKVTKNGCSDTTVCINVTTVGVLENPFENVVISPNPTDHVVTIQLGGLKNVSINVFNQLGQIIHQSNGVKSDSYKLELNSSPGIYTIELISNNEKQHYKVIKK